MHHSRSSTRILEEVRHSRSSSRRDYNAVLDVLGALDVLDVLEAAVLEEVVALPAAPPSQDPMAFLGYGTRYLVALPRKGLDACLTCTEPKDCQTQRELEFPDAPRSCEAPRSCQVLHRLEVPRGREGSATAALEVLVLAMLVLPRLQAHLRQLPPQKRRGQGGADAWRLCSGSSTPSKPRCSGGSRRGRWSHSDAPLYISYG